MGADSGEQEFTSGASTVSTTGKGDLNRDWWNEQPSSLELGTHTRGTARSELYFIDFISHFHKYPVATTGQRVGHIIKAFPPLCPLTRVNITSVRLTQM
jgi:hypothetical protein